MQTLKTNTDNSALVYLLKPAHSRKSLESIEKSGMNSNSLLNIPQQNIQETLGNSRKATTRFLIHTKEETRVILFDEVVCCNADSNYTKIHLIDGSQIMVSKTLKDVEGILFQPQFFRIHASYLINLNYIKRILKNDRFTVELLNKVNLNVSRARRDELMQKMETL